MTQTGTNVSDLEKWRAATASTPLIERDLVGRQTLRHQGIEGYLLMIARIAPGRVRAVPARAVTEENDEEAFALVACPCESRPVVTARLAKCPGCERWYVYVGGRAFVAYGEMALPTSSGG